MHVPPRFSFCSENLSVKSPESVSSEARNKKSERLQPLSSMESGSFSTSKQGLGAQEGGCGGGHPPQSGVY